MRRNLFIAATVLLLLAVIMAGCLTVKAPTPAADAPAMSSGYNTAVHFLPGGNTLEVASGGTVSVLSGGAVTVASGGTMTLAGTTAVTGDLTASGVVTVSTFQAFTPAAVITVTQGATITPAGAYQPIAAAGAVSTGSITALPYGRHVTLINTGSQTITISDTGTLKLSGDAALGATDSLVLWSDGTNWIRVGGSDN